MRLDDSPPLAHRRIVGMAWVRVRSPPVLQSKLLCVSLLYLLTTLPLAVYVSFSEPGAFPLCLLLLPSRSSSTAALFEYPRDYGERKHALSTARALCSDPAVFAEYKTVFEEINGLCRNLSASPRASRVLRYQNGSRDSFAGNFSTEERRSYFTHTDSAVEIPCGFFKEFPLSQADVPDTAVIIRRHGLASDLFSCLMFNELEAFNPRDQLAFAYVRDLMSPKVSMNMFEVEVFEHIAVEYRHNLKRDSGRGGGKQGITRLASLQDISGSSCESYLMKMWG